MIIKIDKSIHDEKSVDMSQVSIISYKVPTRMSVMHRIVVGPKSQILFTEKNTNKVGKVIPY